MDDAHFIRADYPPAEPREGCFICVACSGDPRAPSLDRPLCRQPGVGAVIAAAGPLGPGYVLVVPERHFTDIASALRLHPGLRDFVERSLTEYETLFGEYTVWEHGSAVLDIPTSGCIPHAHLNVIPKTSLTKPTDAHTVCTWDDFARLARTPYLLLGGSGPELCFGRDSGISQHYRREWARLVGQMDRWDYAVGGIPGLQQETATRYRLREPAPWADA